MLIPPGCAAWLRSAVVLIFWFAASCCVRALEVPLTLEARTAHQMTVTQSDGVWTMKTPGVDPYVGTSAVEMAALEGARVLTFEYMCLGEISPFSVFVGVPWSESRTVNAAELSYSEGWSRFAIDLGDVLSQVRTPTLKLRLDFGSRPGQVVHVRGVALRGQDPAERAAAEKRIARAADESALENELRWYLGRKTTARVARVTVARETIEIVGETGGEKGELWLAEVPVWQQLTRVRSFAHVKRLSGTRFACRVPRHVAAGEGMRDRLLSRWVVVRKGEAGDELLSAARYADEVAARAALPEGALRSKKGLGGYHAGVGKLENELEILGIDSVTVNLPLSSYFRSQATARTSPFVRGGKTFFFDRKEIERLDGTLKAAAARGAVVFGIILLPPAGRWASADLGRLLQHPDYDPAGVYCMPNLTEERAVEQYAAMLDFLAERYGREGNPHGRIHHWIVHNEVDAGWTWTNCGEKPPLVFVDLYHRSMRLAQLIARQYDPRARAYIPLTHFWTWTASRRYVPSREVLRHLLAYSRAEGDFDWGIAHHPYPESLMEPKTWLDRKALYRFDTPLITFKNIEVLDAWVKLPQNRFEGKTVRSVHLTEQGPNSPDYGEKALAEQAAAMAYMWKKIRRLDSIEGFQYHNWIDNRAEEGLRIGLRRYRDDPVDPLGAKPVWHVYRALGTEKEDEACAFALPLIGLRSWDEAEYRGPIDGEP